MTQASQLSDSPNKDLQVKDSSEQSASSELDPQLGINPSLSLRVVTQINELLMSWLSLSLSLFALESVSLLSTGSQYWLTLVLSQWGLMTTLSLIIVMSLQVLKITIKHSWPQFARSSSIQKFMTIILLILSLLSMVLCTQLSVEWTSKQFRQVSYRGLFTGLVAAFTFMLNILFMPLLVRLLTRLGHIAFRKLPIKLGKENKEEAKPELSSEEVKPKSLLRAFGLLLMTAIVYHADQIAIWSLPKLENIDLRPVSLLLNALWLSLFGLYSFKWFLRSKILLEPRAQQLKRTHYLISSVMLLSMGVGLSSAYYLSPEQFLKLERDSALSSLVIKQVQKQSDRDHDGLAAHWGGGDCNDNDAKQRPGLMDQKQKDLNCNGVIRLSHYPFTPKSKSVVKTPKQRMKTQKIPQNVILLTIDALRYDAFREEMPFTQEFAKKAVDFTKAYSAGAATYWSVPALLGSRPPSFFEMGRDQTPVNRERLLTESLRDSAFHTALYANVTIFFVRGLSQGAYTKNYDTSRHTVHGAKPGAAHLTNGLIKHLDRFQAGKLKPKRDRFFLWGHYYDPHDPYFEVQGQPAKDQSSHARYRAIVRSVDQELNRLYKALETRGLLDNTMVILTADHGDEFYDHNHRFHGKTLYDEMVKVPLLIYSPAYNAQKVEQVVSHLDVAPTVLSHLGLRNEKRFMGFDHDSALKQSKTLSKDEAFFEVLPDQNYARHLLGLRLGDEKMIYSLHRGAIEHYNLLDDPSEKLNLFNRQSAYENQEIYQKLMRYAEAQLYVLSQGKAGVRLPKSRR